MSIDNLKDVQSGLKKYNGSPNILELANEQLKKKGEDKYQYVERAPHEVT